MKLELSREDARRISAVALVASTDNFRPILAGILFEPDGTVVATDSYRMAHCQVKGLGGDGATKECDRLLESSILLPAAELAKALAPACKSDVPSILDTEGEAWAVTVAGVTTTGRIIDGTFPTWRMLIPSSVPDTIDQSSGFGAAFSSQYLAELAKIARTLADSVKDARTISTRVTLHGKDKPSEFRVGPVHYLLMPVRVN